MYNTSETYALESEFIPPVDLFESSRESLGQPWEKQIRAVNTWQDALASLEGQAALADSATMIVPPLPEIGSSPAGLGGSGNSAGQMNMRTIMVMNTLLLSLRERLLQIQNETANLAIDNISHRHSSVAEPRADGDATPMLAPDSAARLEVLVSAWFDIMAAAQSKMRQLTGLGPAQGVPGTPQVFHDRRRHAQVIDFPDRRLAS